MSGPKRVALIGSGNWGSAMARAIGANCAAHDNFIEEVKMWVYEEVIEGRKLSEIINEKHENVKYLPGIPLPSNIIAEPDLEATCKGADVLVVVIPHQVRPKPRGASDPTLEALQRVTTFRIRFPDKFDLILPFICGCNLRLYQKFLSLDMLAKIKAVINPGCVAISLIKGITFDDKGPVLLSSYIQEHLGTNCAVLMGANIANDVARDEFCETTIGCSDSKSCGMWKKLFQRPMFIVHVINDVAGPELCGALKNVVAVAVGMCDGLGLGNSTKAAVMRLGMMEMIRFSKSLFTEVQSDTFLESCGVADLVATCYGGRNSRVAAKWTSYVKDGTPKTWEEVEDEMLNGQKLQGTGTLQEVMTVLTRNGLVDKYPMLLMLFNQSRSLIKSERFF